ncbi:unnamed protein product, partial [Pleuronectes platessa]
LMHGPHSPLCHTPTVMEKVQLCEWCMNLSCRASSASSLCTPGSVLIDIHIRAEEAGFCAECPAEWTQGNGEECRCGSKDGMPESMFKKRREDK